MDSHQTVTASMLQCPIPSFTSVNLANMVISYSDWERVVVDWESFGEYWYKTRLEGSTHGGERHVGPPWSNVPTTVS